MRKNGFLVVMIVVFSFCFLFCHSYTPDESSPTYRNEGEERILIGGYCEVDDCKRIKGYWQDNAWKALENPYNTTVEDKGIAVDKDNNVYVYGNVYDSEGNAISGYWKNGKWNRPDFLGEKILCSLNVDKNGKLYIVCIDNGYYGYFVYDGKNAQWYDCTVNKDFSYIGTGVLTKPIIDSNGNVYFGGYYAVGTESNYEKQPMYYKNGTLIPLKDPYNPSSEKSYVEEVLDMCVDSHNNVYCLGLYKMLNPSYVIDLSDGTYHCGYWKNGTDWTELKDPSIGIIGYMWDPVPKNIAVDNNDSVYVFINYEVKNHSYKTGKYGYWKDGVWIECAIPSNVTGTEIAVDAEAMAITENGMVVVSGNCLTDGIVHAGYWENGTWNAVPNNYHDKYYSWGNYVATNGNSICFTGTSYNGHTQAGYWDDGKWVELTNPYDNSLSSFVTSLTTDTQKHIYAAGCCFDGRKYRMGYWKDKEWHISTEFDNYDFSDRDIYDIYEIVYDEKNDDIIFYNGDNGFVWTLNKENTSTIKAGYNIDYRKFVKDDEGNIYLGCNGNSSDGTRYLKNGEYVKLNEDGDDINDIAVYEGDVYTITYGWQGSKYGERVWKNNELIPFTDYDEVWDIWGIELSTSGNIILAGDGSSKPSYQRLPFYISDDKLYLCESPHEDVDCYFCDFFLDSNDDCYIAGIALYDNNFFDQKWVPGIWKNGKWTRLENPYGNYYGRISRALVMK